MSVFDFQTKKEITSDYELFKDAFFQSHEKIIELYLEAIRKNNDTTKVFSLLQKFEKDKKDVLNYSFNFKEAFDKDQLFSALISNQLLEKLETFSKSDKNEILRYREKNNEEILYYFENYKTPIFEFEVDLD